MTVSKCESTSRHFQQGEKAVLFEYYVLKIFFDTHPYLDMRSRERENSILSTLSRWPSLGKLCSLPLVSFSTLLFSLSSLARLIWVSATLSIT